MTTFIFVTHVMSCLFLISLILVQHGQGANMGAAFGGSSQTVFGSRGPATFLNKLTIIVAVIFLAASVYLARIAKTEVTSSVVDQSAKIEKTEKAAEGEIAKEAAPAEEANKAAGTPVPVTGETENQKK